MKAKRVSAWILALVMVLTLLPAAVLAKEAASQKNVQLSYTKDSDVYTLGFDTLAKAFEEAPVNEFTVTVLENTQETETADTKSGQNITLYLNGKTVTRKGNGAVIHVKGNSILTIYDTACDTELPSKGTITGGKGFKTGGNTYGGGVYVADRGTLKMYDGIITGNTAQNGGGVFVDAGISNHGTFEMYGGEISGNIATGDNSAGGGVYVKYKFYMYGGKIINNKAVNSSSGGGVYVRKENYAQFSVDPKGPIVIKDNIGPKNSKNNVYLYGSKKIGILLPSNAGAVPLIGVSMGTPGVFTSGLNLGTDQKLLGIFFSDDDAYGVTRAGQEAKLDYAPFITSPTEDQTVSLTYGEEGMLSVSAMLNKGSVPLVYQWYSIDKDVDVPVTEKTEANSTYTIAGDTAAGEYEYYCAVTNGNGVTAISKTFTVTIAKADQAAPTGLVGHNETIKDKADGYITGVDTTMEYYKVGNDTEYKPIDGKRLDELASGDYMVRLKETGNYNVGADAMVTIKPGRSLTVTFDSNGGSDVEKVTGLGWHEKLAEPKPAPTKAGSTFGGWYQDADFAYVVDFDAYLLEGDVTFYAKWTANSPSGVGGGGSATTYKIDLPAETEGGRLSVSPEKAAKGDKVTITAKSDEGYEAVKPTVTDKDGKDVELTENADGSWSFTMPGSDVTVTGGFKKAETGKQPEAGEKFVDVPADAWYHDDVYWAVDRGVTTGADDSHFAPDADCTRAQFVTFLWRAAGKPAPTSTVNPFEDVKADAYYYEAVLWAVEKGVTNGSDATHFAPDAPVTRAQAMTFLYRYEQTLGGGFKGLWAFQLDFSDAADVPDWAYEAFCWMVKEGVCKGSDGMLLPGKLCPRCEVVALLARCFR